MSKPVTTIPATQAREQLADLMHRTYFNAEGFMLERRGIPMSVLISVREYESLLVRRGESPVALHAQQVHDPLAVFAGAIESGIPDLAAQHDDHVGQVLAHELGDAQDA